MRQSNQCARQPLLSYAARVLWHTLAHVSYSSHTIGYIAVACDPATVSCTPVHIIWLGIKDILGGQGRPYHVPPRGVLHPLGLAC